jgi:hypothetical protein
MKTWIMSVELDLINVDYVRRIYAHGPDVFADVADSEPTELVRCSSQGEAKDTLSHLMTALTDPNEGVVYPSPIGNVVNMEGVLNDVRARAPGAGGTGPSMQAYHTPSGHPSET